LLSDEPGLNERLLHPQQSHPREYWAQIEASPRRKAVRSKTDCACRNAAPGRVARGFSIRRRALPERDPPIRFAKRFRPKDRAELVEGKTAGAPHDRGGLTSHAPIDPRADRTLRTRALPGTGEPAGEERARVLA
jgi:hypothetical protein